MSDIRKRQRGKKIKMKEKKNERLASSYPWNYASDFKRCLHENRGEGAKSNQKFNYVNGDVEWMNNSEGKGGSKRLGQERGTNVAWKIIHINIQRKYRITVVITLRRGSFQREPWENVCVHVCVTVHVATVQLSQASLCECEQVEREW